jgi:uncharacterized membrane protein YhaH (DUF805 family)
LGTFINLLFGYDGRIGRLQCWLGLLAVCVITGLLADNAESMVAGTGDIGRYVAFVVIVGTLIWMHSAVTVKRLHDRNKSAWWYLLYGIAPLAAFIAALTVYASGNVYSPGVHAMAWILFVLSIASLIWTIIELGFLRGTPGPNRYGPAP